MKENIVQKLTSKDDKYACAFFDRIVAESHDTNEWYEYFEDVASLLDHPKSLVRNRALSLRQTHSGMKKTGSISSCRII